MVKQWILKARHDFPEPQRIENIYEPMIDATIIVAKAISRQCY